MIPAITIPYTHFNKVCQNEAQDIPLDELFGMSEIEVDWATNSITIRFIDVAWASSFVRKYGWGR